MAKAKPPVWKHDADTREGKIERATWVFKDGERRGLQVAQTLFYLKSKGLTDDEVNEALNAASGGELVRVGLGCDALPVVGRRIPLDGE